MNVVYWRLPWECVDNKLLSQVLVEPDPIEEEWLRREFNTAFQTGGKTFCKAQEGEW